MSAPRGSRARLAGKIAQGVVLGVLLFIALSELLVAGGGIVLFRYRDY